MAKIKTFIGNVKGSKGDPGDAFTYEDFTEEQLESLKVKGDKGESGITTPINGFFTLAVDDNGDLYTLSAEEGTTPNFEYDSTTGNLYVLQGEIKTLVGNVKGVKGDSGYTPIKGVDYFDGQNGQDGISATHSWNGTTLTVTSASGTSSADLKGDKGDIGEVDYSRLNDYAKLKSSNDLLHNGNEFTFVPAGYNGQVYINHRTAGGVAGNITNYYFGNGNGGLATFIANYFKGKFQGDTERLMYNNQEVAMLTDVPTNVETWTFTLEDGSTVTKKVYIG